MRERELVTRLVMINHTVEKLHDICRELTGSSNYDCGLTGEFDQVTRLLFDIVLEGFPLDSKEGDKKTNEFYEIIWGDASIEEKTNDLLELGYRN